MLDMVIEGSWLTWWIAEQRFGCFEDERQEPRSRMALGYSFQLSLDKFSQYTADPPLSRTRTPPFSTESGEYCRFQAL